MHTDMQMWTEIRRRALVEGASKRSIRRDYGVGAVTLEKILANTEPPGYRRSAPRPEAAHGAVRRVPVVKARKEFIESGLGSKDTLDRARGDLGLKPVSEDGVWYWVEEF